MIDLFEAWPALFFWPTAAMSVLVAAALVGQVSAYLAATERIHVWGLCPVAIYLLAALAIRRNQRVLAVALVGANTVSFGWLAVMLFG